MKHVISALDIVLLLEVPTLDLTKIYWSIVEEVFY